MATVTDVITKIGAANTLLKNNLTAKGVTVPDGATTYAMAGLVSNIQCQIDGIVIQSRDANGHPLIANASHLTLVGGYVPTSMFYSPDVNGIGRTLTTVYLPPGVTKIGTYAFGYCSALQHIYGLDFSAVTFVDGGAFSSCSALMFSTGLTMPLVTSVGTAAFQAANTISGTVALGSHGHAVTSIAANAFGLQSAITSITVYTANGLSSDLSNAPWGATNATISYIKA